MFRYSALDSKGVSALRRGRHSESDRIYPITTVTNGREPLLADFVCGRLVVESIRRETTAERCKTLCFVVMPDHLHWLLHLSSSARLATCINNVKSRSARRINRLRGCGNRVWQKGFYDRALRRDEDVVQTARYIIANPVRAGLVECVGDYPLWDAVWV